MEHANQDLNPAIQASGVTVSGAAASEATVEAAAVRRQGSRSPALEEDLERHLERTRQTLLAETPLGDHDRLGHLINAIEARMWEIEEDILAITCVLPQAPRSHGVQTLTTGRERLRVQFNEAEGRVAGLQQELLRSTGGADLVTVFANAQGEWDGIAAVLAGLRVRAAGLFGAEHILRTPESDQSQQPPGSSEVEGALSETGSEDMAGDDAASGSTSSSARETTETAADGTHNGRANRHQRPPGHTDAAGGRRMVIVGSSEALAAHLQRVRQGGGECEGILILPDDMAARIVETATANARQLRVDAQGTNEERRARRRAAARHNAQAQLANTIAEGLNASQPPAETHGTYEQRRARRDEAGVTPRVRKFLELGDDGALGAASTKSYSLKRKLKTAPILRTTVGSS
ncbi:hypothetical protein LTR08_002269 [Meristemomyces frigidus]|nr:hypothetical protein LTR08_002269 [Meristemomyces frigidus]